MSLLIVLVGPTASGKTAVAMEIAKKFNGEIVCADSRTVYKGMDIGTAKPSKQEQAQIPHHLLDVVRPDEPFTVADFKKLAEQAINDIQHRNKIPIMVGGSGLYVDAVLFDYKFAPKNSPRDSVNSRHLDKEVPAVRSKIRPNTLVVGLNPDLQVLKQRITERVEAMVQDGLVEEVKELCDQYGTNVKALDATSYKAFREYVENKITLDEAKAQFVRNDYLLARRQRTWFKRNKSIHWFTNREEIVEFITTELNKNK